MTSNPDNGPNGVAEVLQRALAGDDVAWAEVVHRVDPLLRSIVGRYPLDAADRHDVLQSVWVRFLERHHTIRKPECAIGWLGTTARREALRTLTRQCRERSCVTGCVALTEPQRMSPEECVVRAERDRSVWSAACRLAERDRRLAVLVAFESGISYAALAGLLGVVESSVGVVRGRCLHRMRRLLADEGITDASL
ncbi:MAG: RNA polymerase sigma factor [Haloechinothrix sp.]